MGIDMSEKMGMRYWTGNGNGMGMGMGMGMEATTVIPAHLYCGLETCFGTAIPAPLVFAKLSIY